MQLSNQIWGHSEYDADLFFELKLVSPFNSAESWLVLTALLEIVHFSKQIENTCVICVQLWESRLVVHSLRSSTVRRGLIRRLRSTRFN